MLAGGLRQQQAFLLILVQWALAFPSEIKASRLRPQAMIEIDFLAIFQPIERLLMSHLTPDTTSRQHGATSRVVNAFFTLLSNEIFTHANE